MLLTWDDIKDTLLTPEEQAESAIRVAKMVKAIDARNERERLAKNRKLTRSINISPHVEMREMMTA